MSWRYFRVLRASLAPSSAQLPAACSSRVLSTTLTAPPPRRTLELGLRLVQSCRIARLYLPLSFHWSSTEVHGMLIRNLFQQTPRGEALRVGGSK